MFFQSLEYPEPPIVVYENRGMYYFGMLDSKKNRKKRIYISDAFRTLHFCYACADRQRGKILLDEWAAFNPHKPDIFILRGDYLEIKTPFTAAKTLQKSKFFEGENGEHLTSLFNLRGFHDGSELKNTCSLPEDIVKVALRPISYDSMDIVRVSQRDAFIQSLLWLVYTSQYPHVPRGNLFRWVNTYANGGSIQSYFYNVYSRFKMTHLIEEE